MKPFATRDELLAGAAKEMRAAAQKGRPLTPILKRRCPHIYRQIVAVEQSAGFLDLWGRSLNVDENTQERIVAPAILQAIGHLAGVSMESKANHAGLTHTYGYLFSLAETPYGFKRERWTSSELDDGFGFTVPTLRDVPDEGTLLSNVTWFASRLAFRGTSRSLRQFEAAKERVSPLVYAFDYEKQPICRIVERVRFSWGSGHRVVNIHTDLVRFPCRRSGIEDDTALIYSLRSGDSMPRLITLFAVNGQPVAELTAKDRFGTDVAVQLRYNAYLAGVSGRCLSGERWLEEL